MSCLLVGGLEQYMTSIVEQGYELEGVFEGMTETDIVSLAMDTFQMRPGHARVRSSSASVFVPIVAGSSRQ